MVLGTKPLVFRRCYGARINALRRGCKGCWSCRGYHLLKCARRKREDWWTPRDESFLSPSSPSPHLATPSLRRTIWKVNRMAWNRRESRFLTDGKICIKRTIDLENILDRIYPLRTLEMAFQSTKISKFSGGACPQTPLVASPFGANPICRWLKKKKTHVYILKKLDSLCVNMIPSKRKIN